MTDYAQIWVNLNNDAVDKPFHYRVPSSLQGEVYPGRIVKVPFGKQRLWGCVEKKVEEPEIPPEKIREVIAVEDSRISLNYEMLELSKWASRYYYCRFMEAVNLMLPPGYGKVEEKREKYIYLSPWVREQTTSFWVKIKDKAPRQAQLLKELINKESTNKDFINNQGVSWKELSKNTGADINCLRALQSKGMVEVKEMTSQKLSWLSEIMINTTCNEKVNDFSLTQEQYEATTKICETITKQLRSYFLLHGITGSGKTEVYLRSIQNCLKEGRKALLLLPEIALTPQMVSYFAKKLSSDIVLLHSSLPLRERYQQWLKIKEGSGSVVLGTRSAVFAPLDNLGLVIVDEEQENSYKQEESPRYHAKEVAEWRAEFHRAVMVWGSATPSVESYYRASQDELKLINMSNRATPYALPLVEIVDMRKELKDGHTSIFSRQLIESLKKTFEQGEQALLFINRRGFSSFVLCRECGHVVRCQFCSVSLTFHAQSGKMMCHYCSFITTPPEKCPACNGSYIKYFGTGTQRVEQEVLKLFPGYEDRVVRMDRDSTTKKGAHQKLWENFRSGKTRIMIGTQMIAKGMDFPGVTLVGVIAADTALHLPDFRAPERTFQLITQVSGRAGRGLKEGMVLVQTYHPHHYSLLCAKEHDYKTFFTKEITTREELKYPPFSQLLRLVWVAQNDGEANEAASKLAENLKEALSEVEILGPAPAPLFRLKGYYRYHLVIKGHDLSRIYFPVNNLVREFRQSSLGQKVRLIVDFNPLSML